VQPRPFTIAGGIALAMVSLWLIFSFIPSKRPMSEAEQVVYLARAALDGDVAALEGWRLTPAFYPVAFVIAALIGVVGVASIVGGATHRPRRLR
jgi:hypothetical protein